MVRVQPDTAGHDRPAGQDGKAVTADRDAVSGELGTRKIGIGVIADTKSDLSKLCEGVVLERHIARRCHLDGRRHLAPFLPHGFEFRATPVAGLVGIGRADRGRFRQESTALLAGIAGRPRRPHPACVGEAQSLEGQVLHRLVHRATDADQGFKAWQDDFQLVDVAVGRNAQVELAGSRIDIEFVGRVVPFIGAAEQFRRIDQEQARILRENRLADGVIAPGVIVP